jgi:peroxin-14
MDEGLKLETDMPVGASSEPREDLIETAVKFLQNAKVRQSPFAQRKAFLLRKGLTETEVEDALRRSGTSADVLNVQTTTPNNSTVISMTPVVAPAPRVWDRLREIISMAAFIGGILYALYQFYKKFIFQWLFGKPTEDNSKVIAKNSDKSITDSLQHNVTEVVSVVADLQRGMSRLNEQVDNFVKTSASDRGGPEKSRMNMSELKDEIRSLKSLLLNKHQFPAVPATTPMLPAWQLQMNSKSAKSFPSDSVKKNTVANNQSAIIGSDKQSHIAACEHASLSASSSVGSNVTSDDQKFQLEETQADNNFLADKVNLVDTIGEQDNLTIIKDSSVKGCENPTDDSNWLSTSNDMLAHQGAPEDNLSVEHIGESVILDQRTAQVFVDKTV